MAIGNRIPGFLFIMALLMSFSGVNGTNTALTWPVFSKVYDKSSRDKIAKKSDAVAKHTFYKNRIKVRYKGGECPNFAIAPLVRIASATFAERTSISNYRPVISSHHFFLFKLRGPPGC